MGGPVTRRRRLYLVGESRDPHDDILRELVAVEIVQHDHVERRRRRALLLVAGGA